MRLGAHFSLLLQGVGCWTFFWLCGWPDYYQQYSTMAVAIGSILLTAAIGIAAVLVLIHTKPPRRLMRATWISFYYTVPLAALDTIYCGVYLGHGVAYVEHYWYLTIFYFTPWLQFVPTALLLRHREVG